MAFVQLDNPRDTQLLDMCNLPLNRFKKILAVVRNANDVYYQLSKTHIIFHKMLLLTDTEIEKDLDYRFMKPEEKQDWLKIRNIKTGDRSFINRYLNKELKQELPVLYTELVENQSADHANRNLPGLLSMSDDIDALLLGASVPAYFSYLEQITNYKRGIFSKLRRGYISYLQARTMNVISHFLRAFEADLTIIEPALLDQLHLEAWQKMGDILGEICDRADPHHHDHISTYIVNCLRSIYISIFNIALNLMLSNRPVPIELRKVLPIIPDKISFNREQLIEDDAWERYQDHLFLFQRAPLDRKNELEKLLCELPPVQRIAWIGCLGKNEIHNLVKPILARNNYFEELAHECLKIPQTDKENDYFRNRVMDVLGSIYISHYSRKKTTSKKVHALFARTVRAKRALKTNNCVSEKVDLMVLRSLSFLVVDDSNRIRQITLDVLKKAGIQNIVSAENGAIAWDLIQKQVVDVVLCDWIMPEITGIQLIKKIMSVDKLATRTTFIMLTTVNNKASIVEALSAGVRGYLMKPFTRRQLLEKVYFATKWLRREQQETMTGVALL